MPDATTLGAGFTDIASTSEEVQVYQLNAVTDMWEPKGSPMVSGTDADLGSTIDMPSSDTIIAGASGFPNGYGGVAWGYVRVMDYDGVDWVDRTPPIIRVGEDLAFIGRTVRMPSVNTMAYDVQALSVPNGLFGGIEVYDWDGQQWNLRGAKILMSDELFPASFDLPTVDTVGYVDGNLGQFSVRQWDGSNWSLKGTPAVSNNGGYSLKMPDEDTILITGSNGNANLTYPGSFVVMRWDGTSWQQKGSIISGSSDYQRLGQSATMPDANTVFVSSRTGNSVRKFTYSGTDWIEQDLNNLGIFIDDRSAVGAFSSDVFAVGSVYTNNPIKVYNLALLSVDDTVLSSIKIYPNPTDSDIHLEWDHESFLEVEVYSIDGRQLSIQMLEGTDKRIKLPQSSGIYMLSVSNETGSAKFKVVKR